MKSAQELRSQFPFCAARMDDLREVGFDGARVLYAIEGNRVVASRRCLEWGISREFLMGEKRRLAGR